MHRFSFYYFYMCSVHACVCTCVRVTMCMWRLKGDFGSGFSPTGDLGDCTQVARLHSAPSAELSWQPDGEACMWLVSWRVNVKYLSYFRDVSFNELTSLPTEGLNGLNQLKLVGNLKLKGALAARDFANLRCVCLCPLFLLLVIVGPTLLSLLFFSPPVVSRFFW